MLSRRLDRLGMGRRGLTYPAREGQWGAEGGGGGVADQTSQSQPNLMSSSSVAVRGVGGDLGGKGPGAYFRICLCLRRL